MLTESPTMPIAYPAASPVKPHESPAAKCMNPLNREYGWSGSTKNPRDEETEAEAEAEGEMEGAEIVKRASIHSVIGVNMCMLTSCCDEHRHN